MPGFGGRASNGHVDVLNALNAERQRLMFGHLTRARRSGSSCVLLDEFAQDRRWVLDVALQRRLFQRLGRLGGKVAVILVDVYARADAVGVEFGVKLRGICV